MVVGWPRRQHKSVSLQSSLGPCLTTLFGHCPFNAHWAKTSEAQWNNLRVKTVESAGGLALPCQAILRELSSGRKLLTSPVAMIFQSSITSQCLLHSWFLPLSKEEKVCSWLESSFYSPSCFQMIVFNSTCEWRINRGNSTVNYSTVIYIQLDLGHNCTAPGNSCLPSKLPLKIILAPITATKTTPQEPN